MPSRLPGYRLIKGDSARRYLTPGGQTISRREYDNRRAQAAGFRNRYELEKFRSDHAGSKWLADIHQHTGRPPSWETYHDWKEVTERRAALKAQYGPGTHSELDQHDPELTAADGPLARLLDAAGKRPISGRPVGAS